MNPNGRETEIKLKVEGPATARTALRRAGFRLWKRRVFERNEVYDTPGQSLRQRGALLRVRTAGDAATLTYKGPGEAGKHKSREEIETKMADAQAFEAILERLGYRSMFRYEKYRMEFRQRGRDGVATLDETPIGTFMELEGEPEWIDQTAHELGFSEKDYITASYGRLYLDWCAERGVEPSHMVFGEPNEITSAR